MNLNFAIGQIFLPKKFLKYRHKESGKRVGAVLPGTKKISVFKRVLVPPPPEKIHPPSPYNAPQI